MSEQIFIADCIVAKPGQARAVLDAYLQRYVPAAQARGMVLQHQWISPPLALAAPRVNTLTFVWAVEDMAGWWGQRIAASFDPAVSEFWVSLAPFVSERSRNFYTEASLHV
jgi:hypothetical protein